MASDDSFDAGSAAIADLDCVTVENLAVFIVGWEMLVYQGEELFTDVCCYSCVIGWIEPYDASCSRSSGFLLLRKLQLGVESGGLQGCFVVGFRTIEF